MTNAFTDWLTQLPRQTLGHWPTPLVLLPRLSAELGGPRIWLKRDDCSGLATGGNKTRKLEYLLGAALAQGTDTIVTYGAVQVIVTMPSLNQIRHACMFSLANSTLTG